MQNGSQKEKLVNLTILLLMMQEQVGFYLYTIYTVQDEMRNVKAVCKNCMFTFKGNLTDALSGWYKGEL